MTIERTSRTPQYLNPRYLLLDAEEALEMGFRATSRANCWKQELRNALGTTILAGPSKTIKTNLVKSLIMGSMDQDNWIRLQSESRNTFRANTINLRSGLNMVCLCKNVEPDVTTRISVLPESPDYLMAVRGSKGSMIIQVKKWLLPMFPTHPDLAVRTIVTEIGKLAVHRYMYICPYVIQPPPVCKGHIVSQFWLFRNCRICGSNRQCRC